MGLRIVFSKLFVFVCAALLPLALVAPAHAAPKPSVSIKASATSVVPGKTVSFTGSVSRNSAGASVSLQRLDGSVWVSVGSGKVSKKKKFSLSTRAPSGTHSYRIRVAGNKKIKTAYSKSIRVTGTVRVSVSPAMVGENFTVSAQLTSFVSRPVVVQRRVGNEWVDFATGTTSATGLAVVNAALSETAAIRVHAPAAIVAGKNLATWNSSQASVQVVSWDRPAALKILADINAVRKKAKKNPLKLHWNNSTVAQNWSEYLHDSDEFHHNPNYSTLISAGWKRAGENIAAGQTASTVVAAWRASPGHYANMIGDYTHVGIGVYEGPNGYKRYFTTVFAKY